MMRVIERLLFYVAVPAAICLLGAALIENSGNKPAAQRPDESKAASDQTADHDRALALTIDLAQCRQDLDIARTARNQSFVACVAALPMSHPDMARLIEECAGVTHEQ